MKIIFFGSDIFAVPSLEALARQKFQVMAVVTQTDKEKGRHLHLGYSEIKKSALKLGLNILQPDKINEPKFIQTLKDLQPDLFVVAAYGKILSQTVLDIPRIMAINIHGSLLPKFRGAAPINWAIINGEAETGVTLIRMNAKMDAGEIISRAAIKIDRTDTTVILREKLSVLGAKNLVEILRKIQQKENISLVAQDEKLVSFAPKLKKSDGLIDWNQSALAIHNRIRGLLPWPGSFTHYQDKIIKILSSESIEGQVAGGLVGRVAEISKDGIMVETGKGLLKIKELQLESAKPLPAWQFFAGHQIEIGYRFA